MSRELLQAALLGQQHEPPAGAHFVLLAGVAVAAIAILGVRRWRGRRDAGRVDEQPTSHGSAEGARSPEDK